MILGNKVLGLGCSFTWGEGLYFYSGLPNLPFGETHNFQGIPSLSNSHIKFKDKHRYLKLVANYYGLQEVSNVGNGGSNVRNITDFAELFTITDFSLIIIQLTSPDRDFINQRRTNDGHLTGDPMPIEDQIEFINKNVKDWEKNNIKVVTFSWYPEFPNNQLYQTYFKHNHVDIEVDGVVKNSFEYFLQNDKYNVTISSDFKSKGLQKNDLHFNLKGHQCIANSILKKLKKDNWKYKIKYI